MVVLGEQDLLTPPWQGKKVADAISGARYELVTGAGSSHGLHLERPEDLVRIVTEFLRHHELEPTPVNYQRRRSGLGVRLAKGPAPGGSCQFSVRSGSV